MKLRLKTVLRLSVTQVVHGVRLERSETTRRQQ